MLKYARNTYPDANIDSFSHFKYHDLTRTEYGRVSNTFGNSLFPISCRNILEIGCSSGETTKELLVLNPSSFILAIDRNASLVELAKSNCAIFADRVKFLVGDGYELATTLKNECVKTFGAIFAMNNLMYVAKEMPKPVRDSICLQLLHHLDDLGILLLSAGQHYVILNKTGHCERKIIDGSSSRLFYVYVDVPD